MLALASLAACKRASHRPPPPPPIVDAAVAIDARPAPGGWFPDDASIAAHVAELASPALRGRGDGTPDEAAAAARVAAWLREAGAEPAGDDMFPTRHTSTLGPLTVTLDDEAHLIITSAGKVVVDEVMSGWLVADRPMYEGASEDELCSNPIYLGSVHADPATGQAFVEDDGSRNGTAGACNITCTGSSMTSRCGNGVCELGESADDCCDCRCACLRCPEGKRCESPNGVAICVDSVLRLKD